MNKNHSPYYVWGAHLQDKMNGRCEGFICEGHDLRKYDPKVWIFLGGGDYGEKVFTFDEPLDTFVLNWVQQIGFDSLSGTTIDNQTVTYGYLTDGQISASYLDGSNFPIETISQAEEQGIPVKTPCGIIDSNPEGDNNYNITGEFEGWLGGGMVWNFLDHPFDSAFETRKGYSLKSLKIITNSISNISSDQICP